MGVSKDSLTTAIKEALVGVDLALTGRRAIREKVEIKLGTSITDQKDLFKKLLQECVCAMNETSESDDSAERVAAKVDSKTSAKRKVSAKNATVKPPVKKRKMKERDPLAPPRMTGLSAPQILSEKMSKLMGGETEMSRTGVVKQLWVLIRQRELQDPSNKRIIICDQEFKDVFGVDSMSMFEMNRLLSNHVTSRKYKVEKEETKIAAKVAL
eukprot:CFRG3554T1